MTLRRQNPIYRYKGRIGQIVRKREEYEKEQYSGWMGRGTLKLTLACESIVLHWNLDRNLRLALIQRLFQLDKLSTWLIGTLVMERALDLNNEGTSTKNIL